MDDFASNGREQAFDISEKFYQYLYRAKLLLRKWGWILLLTISMGIGYQAYQEMKRDPMFVSSAEIIVSGRIALPENALFNEEFSHFFGTQIALMKSSRVQQRARERVQMLHPELKPVSVGLNAYQKSEAAIFVLQARGGEPDYTQAFLDAVLQEYLNLRREMRSKTSESTLLAITEQLLQLEEEIDQQENELVEFQKRNNMVFVQEQGSVAGTNLSNLKTQEAELKTQIKALETLNLEIDVDEFLLSGKAEGVLDSSLLESSQIISDTRDSLAQMKAERSEYALYLKPRHPKMISLQREIERTQNYLTILQKQSYQALQEQRQILRARLENLQVLIREWETTALDNSRRLAEFERLRSRLNRSQVLHERLLSSIKSIDVNLNVGQEIVAVLENASKAYEIKVSFAENVVKGGILGFILGAGVIFLLGLIDNRVISADDLKTQFEFPVMGIIPKENLNNSDQVELLHPKDERHLFAEACRTLRSSLLFMEREGQAPKMIMITSSVPEDGKSTVATNLAVALSFTSSRTLLVDADLRRGRLHDNLGLPSFPGLAEMIQQRRSLKHVVQETAIANLDFVATGVYPERPGELLLSPRMDEIMAEFEEAYDYIIIDTAPILATDDTTGFAVKADAILFTVRSAQTQLRQVKTSLDRLTARGANIAGFVLNSVDIKGTDYYYYNKYNNYYAYSAR